MLWVTKSSQTKCCFPRTQVKSSVTVWHPQTVRESHCWTETHRHHDPPLLQLHSGGAGLRGWEEVAVLPPLDSPHVPPQSASCHSTLAPLWWVPVTTKAWRSIDAIDADITEHFENLIHIKWLTVRQTNHRDALHRRPKRLCIIQFTLIEYNFLVVKCCKRKTSEDEDLKGVKLQSNLRLFTFFPPCRLLPSPWSCRTGPRAPPVDRAGGGSSSWSSSSYATSLQWSSMWLTPPGLWWRSA